MATALLVMGLPGLAIAATRYASPSGSSSQDCKTQMTACDLKTAVNNAASGDDVIVLAGNYSLSSSLSPASGVSLTGQTGSPPVINMSGATNAGSYMNNGSTQSTVSNLDLESTSGTQSAISVSGGAVATHLVIGFSYTTLSGPPIETAIVLGGGSTLADSAIRASGPQVSGVAVTQSNGGSATAAGNLINDTVYATGNGSTGVNALSACFPFPPGSETADANLENTIAHGDSSGVETSRVALSSCSPPVSSMTVSYSNYDGALANNGNVTDNGHNQTAAAQTAPSTLFVSAPGDLHERAGAPTIDAGSSVGIETTDLDNNPRVQGPAPDIGAYETFRTSPPPRAPARCVVPKLKGKTLKKARKALAAAHCALGKAKKPKHHKGGKLVVKSQSVAPGTVLANGTSVAVKLRPKPHHK